MPMNPDDLVALNEEIAALARAGLPLDQGLKALAKEMGRGQLRRVSEAIASDLQAGHTLPEALERQGTRVPPYYANLVEAGIRTGRINEVLITLTTYARSLATLRTIVFDALFYPGMVIVFAILLFTFFCYCILPGFDELFRDFRMTLPLPTRIVLLFGQFPLAFLLVPLAVFLLGMGIARLRHGASSHGRKVWAQGIYGVPIVGTMIRASRLAAFTDLLAILVEQEMPLPEAFRLAGAASSDPIVADAAEEIYQELSAGQPLGKVLKGRGLVPEWVSWMVAHGEKSGTLGKNLRQIAEMYTKQATMRANLLRSVLPGFAIIFTGAVILALFVLGLILPLVTLMEGLAK